MHLAGLPSADWELGYCAASRTCCCKSAWTGSFEQRVASSRLSGRPERCTLASHLLLFNTSDKQHAGCILDKRCLPT